MKITVNRVDGEKLSFKVSIDDTELVFTAQTESKAGATVSDGTVSLKIASSGSYGQRVAFVPAHNSIVRIYGLTLPE